MLYSPMVHRSNSGCPENPFRKANQNCSMYIRLIMYEHMYIDDSGTYKTISYPQLSGGLTKIQDHIYRL